MKHAGQFYIIDIITLPGKETIILFSLHRVAHAAYLLGSFTFYHFNFFTQFVNEEAFWILDLFICWIFLKQRIHKSGSNHPATCISKAYSKKLVFLGNKLGFGAWKLRTSYLGTGILYRLDDIIIAGTSAQIAGDTPSDFLFCGVRILFEQFYRTH